MGLKEYMDKHETTAEHKEVIDNIETYLTEESEHNVKFKEFEGFKGGTEELGNELYNRAMDTHKKFSKKLAEADDKKKDEILESAHKKLLADIVDETLSGLKGNKKLQKKLDVMNERIKHGVHEGSADEYRVSILDELAAEHLGIGYKGFAQIAAQAINHLKSGKEDQYRAQIAQLRDNMKEGLYQLRVDQTKEALKDKETKLSANIHYLKKMGKHGAVPKQAAVLYNDDPLNLRKELQIYEANKKLVKQGADKAFESKYDFSNE